MFDTNKFSQIKKSKKNIIIGAIALVLLIILIGGGGNKEEVVKDTVTLNTIESSINLSGSVLASDNVSLNFNSSGVVAGVYIKEGQMVKEGDRLLELENASLRAELLSAEANLELQKAQSNVSNAELDRAVENAYTELLNNDLRAYPKNEDDDYEAVAPTVSGSYLSKKEGAYEIQVYPSSSNSGESYRIFGLETGTSSVNESSPSSLGQNGLFLNFDSDYSYKNTEWIVPIPNTRSSTYISALNAYKAALASRDATESNSASRQISEARIKQAEAEVAKIRAQINERILRAPFSGTVSFVGPTKGESISSSDVAVSMISEDNYEVKIKIPEVDLAKILPNMKVEIELDAYKGEKFSGYVFNIDPAETIVDGVSVYEATIYFDEQNIKIKSGMTANVSVINETRENVLSIKKQFIEKDDLGEYVYVDDREEQIKTYIKTGIVGSNGLVEIISGLNSGDVIIGKF
ncbi:MAG: HlyD family secretion protein [Patescibacteria group bacterium]|jgi:multidrug efflux pump subunit AcrA (membrane-fusion protein)|nr:HlyD family secretion protein [Patescibacteria group bacterium]